MKDFDGRNYAKITDLRAGDRVTVDGAFDCLKAWSQHEVHSERGMVYIKCTQGHHLLRGQIAADGVHLIGIYKSEVQG